MKKLIVWSVCLLLAIALAAFCVQVKTAQAEAKTAAGTLATANGKVASLEEKVRERQADVDEVSDELRRVKDKMQKMDALIERVKANWKAHLYQDAGMGNNVPELERQRDELAHLISVLETAADENRALAQAKVELFAAQKVAADAKAATDKARAPGFL